MPPIARLEQERTSAIGLYPSMDPRERLRSLASTTSANDDVYPHGTGREQAPLRHLAEGKGAGGCANSYTWNGIMRDVLGNQKEYTALLSALLNVGAADGSASARPAEQPLTTMEQR